MATCSAVRMICFDVDGTLVQHADDKTVWQLLNERFLDPPSLNVGRLEAFLAGRISYAEWVDLDVGDWRRRGVRREQLAEVIRSELAPVDGAGDVVRELARRGYRLAIVSGTIDLTLSLLLEELPFDRVFANRIEFDAEGRISGWQATPYDVAGKARALDQLSAEFAIPLEQIAFIGDHWNDLSALDRAGVAIAFRPKDERVIAAADIVIDVPDLTRLLRYFPPIPQ